MYTKFYKLLFLLIFLSFMNCIRDKNPANTVIKYFDPELLDQLDIENINDFWGSDTLITMANSKSSTAVNSQELIKCARYKCNDKYIGISVFPSQNSSIYSVESIIDNVACIIQKDTTSNLTDLYWFSDCIPNMVFTNKWNTIIEVGYYHQSFKEVKKIIYNTASEIAIRVDKLSDRDWP